MPNESGVNQFGGFTTQLPYGDKERQGQLQRLAPVAGSASSLNDPKRAQRAAVKGAPLEPPPPPMPELQGAPQIPTAELYARIAGLPGVSPLVQQIFGT